MYVLSELEKVILHLGVLSRFSQMCSKVTLQMCLEISVGQQCETLLTIGAGDTEVSE